MEGKRIMLNKTLIETKAIVFNGYFREMAVYENQIEEKISEVLLYLCKKFNYELSWWEYNSSSKTFFGTYIEGAKEIGIYITTSKDGYNNPYYKYPDGTLLDLSDGLIPLFWIFDDCDYKLEIDNIYTKIVEEKKKKAKKAQEKREASKQKKSEAKLLENEWNKLSLEERKKLLSK